PSIRGCLGFHVNTTPGGVVRDGSRIRRQKPLKSSATRARGAASPSLHPEPPDARPEPQEQQAPGRPGPGQEGDPGNMSSVRLEAVKNPPAKDIPMQPASQDIWDKKYRLKTKTGEAVDADIDGTYQRVARALAGAEPSAEKQKYWNERFLWALRRGAIPAGRITSNAGALAHKPATSTINCTVSGTIVDSMDGILEKVHEAGLTLKAGCGIGYEFSTLRPRGAFVAGAGAYTSGPMSFMDIYDKMCFTVSSAGGRRG